MLAEVAVSTGIAPDALMAHPEVLEHMVDVLQERADG